MRKIQFLLVLALAMLIALSNVALADLVGPTATAYDGTTYTGFGNYSAGNTQVVISADRIYTSDTGSPFATGNLTWTGTGSVDMSFDYTLIGPAGSNAWIQYGDAWVPTAITLSESSSGHIDAIFNLDDFGGAQLFVQAYAGDGTSAIVNNISVSQEVSAVPLLPSAFLLGSGLLSLVGFRGWHG